MAKKVYIKHEAELTDSDAFTFYKTMRDTLKADRVEMTTVDQKKDEEGKATGPKKHKITAYFWAEEALPSFDLQEVSDEQGDS